MKSHQKTLANSVAALALCLLVGCASDPTVSEQNFGNSVRNMIAVQTYDPSTLSTPSSAPVDGTDGQKLEGALGVYRQAPAGTDNVGREININLGGTQ